MKRVGVVAVVLGAIGMMAGVLGASVPFSMPWDGISPGFMAAVFAISVATFIVAMNLLRAGLEVTQDRDGGEGHLATAWRSAAVLGVAIAIVVAVHLVLEQKR
jgi:hypothetical protein